MVQAQQRDAGPSLGDVNARMKKLGFPLITPRIQQQMIQKAPRDRIVRAIFRAADEEDQGARTWLVNFLMGLDVIGEDGQPARQPSAANDSQVRQGAPNQRQQSGRETNSGSNQQNPQSRGGPRDNSDNRSPNRQREERLSVHVYGGKAALCFENDISRSNKQTVSLDAAIAVAERSYDWGNKIRLQMTQAEMPVVAAVLLGIIPKCEFANHGVDKSKGFSMERQQGGKVFVPVFSKGEAMRAVPVEAPDVFRVAGLFVRQLRKEQPWLDAPGVIALLRSTLGQYGTR